jgi:hypothetical protein
MRRARGQAGPAATVELWQTLCRDYPWGGGRGGKQGFSSGFVPPGRGTRGGRRDCNVGPVLKGAEVDKVPPPVRPDVLVVRHL